MYLSTPSDRLDSLKVSSQTSLCIGLCKCYAQARLAISLAIDVIWFSIAGRGGLFIVLFTPISSNGHAQYASKHKEISVLLPKMCEHYIKLCTYI